MLCSQHVAPAQEQRSLGDWYFLQRTAPRTARAPPPHSPPSQGRAIGNPAKIWLSDQPRGELIHETPIVHTDRWLSPLPTTSFPLPTRSAVFEASLFFARSSCIHQPSSETRQKLSEPPVLAEAPGSSAAFSVPPSRIARERERERDRLPLPSSSSETGALPFWRNPHASCSPLQVTPSLCRPQASRTQRALPEAPVTPHSLVAPALPPCLT